MKNKQSHFDKCFGANDTKDNCVHFENTKSQHTPTPWHLHDMQMGIICDQEGKTVADIMVNHQKEHVNIFNAAFIVRACNSHSKMLLLLKEISILYRELNISDELEKRILESIDEASQ